ncbi:MAG: hypothetical protein HQ557_10200 [Bacteroidetes bacterium]|nr:hypothetical protein [Bacteroidota bacterium]
MTKEVQGFISSLITTIRNDINNKKLYSDFRPCTRDVLWESDGLEAEKEEYYTHPKQRIEILANNFRPIPASRKKAGLYRIAYVYPEDIPDKFKARRDSFDLFSSRFQRKHPLVINNERIKNSFPKVLAERASSLRSLLRKKQCYFLSGERGVGKTAFLNNLFSTKYQIFDHQNVIWIRLDLTRTESYKMTLLEFLDLHTYDILVEKYIEGGNLPRKKQYFEDSDYKSAMETYNKHRKDLSKENLLNWMKGESIVDDNGQVINMRRYFSSKFKPRDQIISHEESMKRAAIYRRFLEEKGYSFIYVIDGLDESTIPLIRYEALKKWGEDILKIAQGKRCPNGLYIICARQESFRDLISHLGGSSIPHETIDWLVWPVDLYRVIENRIELFKSRASLQNKDEGVEYWRGDSGSYVVNLTLKAIHYAFRNIGIEEDLLRKYSRSGHMRALMKFFSDAIWETVSIMDEAYTEENVDFWLPTIAELNKQKPELTGLVEKQLMRKSYRIWTISTLNYLNHYAASIEFISNPKTLAPPGRSSEFPLIPIIWGDIEFESKDGYFTNNLLLKIRILQLVSEQSGKMAKVNNITITLASMYQYCPENITILLKAMVLQRLIDYVVDQDFFLPFDDSFIKITEIGFLVLKVWLSIPEYIEHSMQMSAIPYTLRKDFKKFRIIRIKGPLSFRKGLNVPDYIPKLFRTWAKFIAIISAIEKWESTRLRIFEHWRKEKDYNEVLLFNPEPLTLKIRNTVNNLIKQIIRDAEKNINDSGKRQMLKKLAIEYKVKLPREF